MDRKPDFTEGDELLASFPDLDGTEAIGLVKSIDDIADKVKGRTWSLTTWILTVNTGLVAFCFSFYAEYAHKSGFLLVEFLACGVGVTLCVFLITLINDQGEHLQGYWETSNRLAALHPATRSLYRKRDLDKPVEFPRFCRRLRDLAGLYAVAFFGVGALMVYLSSLDLLVTGGAFSLTIATTYALSLPFGARAYRSLTVGDWVDRKAHAGSVWAMFGLVALFGFFGLYVMSAATGVLEFPGLRFGLGVVTAIYLLRGVTLLSKVRKLAKAEEEKEEAAATATAAAEEEEEEDTAAPNAAVGFTSLAIGLLHLGGIALK